MLTIDDAVHGFGSESPAANLVFGARVEKLKTKIIK
jgi:hypothetical protein